MTNPDKSWLVIPGQTDLSLFLTVMRPIPVVQADRFPTLDAELPLDLVVEENSAERMSIGAAFWVIAGLSVVLWASIVSLVSALS